MTRYLAAFGQLRRHRRENVSRRREGSTGKPDPMGDRELPPLILPIRRFSSCGPFIGIYWNSESRRNPEMFSFLCSNINTHRSSSRFCNFTRGTNIRSIPLKNSRWLHKVSGFISPRSGIYKSLWKIAFRVAFIFPALCSIRECHLIGRSTILRRHSFRLSVC